MVVFKFIHVIISKYSICFSSTKNPASLSVNFTFLDGIKSK
jgi:hypothetical protein